MDAIASAFSWIIEFFKNLWTIIQNLFNALTTAIQIFIHVITLTLDLITTFPVWIQGFMICTITITAVYFIVGRQSGKSDTK